MFIETRIYGALSSHSGMKTHSKIAFHGAVQHLKSVLISRPNNMVQCPSSHANGADYKLSEKLGTKRIILDVDRYID